MEYAHDPAEAIRLAGESSRTTHGARSHVHGGQVYGRADRWSYQRGGQGELLSPFYTSAPGSRDEEPLCDEVAAVAGGSFLRKELPEIRGSGYVVESLEAALWAFAKSETFEEGALFAVNLGDDADSTGAVYGQVAGAVYGAEGVPRRWVEKVTMPDGTEVFATNLARSSALWWAEWR